MTRTTCKYLWIALLLAVSVLPLTSHATVSPVVATINGYPLTGEDFNWAFNRIQRVLAAAGKPVQDDTLAATRQMTLQGLFKNELLFVESQALNIRIDPQQVEQELSKLKGELAGGEAEYLKALEELEVSEGTVRRAITRGLAIKQLLEKVFVPEVVLAPDEVELFYRDHPEVFHQPELVRVSHILVKVAADATDAEKTVARGKIERLQQRLQKGESFSVLASEASEDFAAAQGGDLGYFKKGQLLAALDQLVFTLKPRQVSEVVSSEFGYHLVLVTEHKPEQTLAFEPLKEQLQQRLVWQKAQQNAASFIEERMKTAEIIIYFEDLKPAEAKKDE